MALVQEFFANLVVRVLRYLGRGSFMPQNKA